MHNLQKSISIHIEIEIIVCDELKLLREIVTTNQMSQ